MSFSDRQNREYYLQMLRSGITHAKADETPSARRYLERVLDGQTDLNTKAEAAFWMARLSDTREDVQDWLEECLGMNPAHGEARRALLILTGQLKKTEIINPEQPPVLSTETHRSSGRQFDCPQCGSRMAYSADGAKLVCDHCGYYPGRTEADEIQEKNFAIGIATAAGHQHAVAMQSFECISCGAVYLLDAKTTSLTCAHCDSVYTITKRETVNLVPPEAIIPFATTIRQVQEYAATWLNENRVKQAKDLRLHGVYLPIWTFDIDGAMDWRCLVYDSNREEWVTKTGTKAVFFDDIIIPCSAPMNKELAELLVGFDKDDLIDYDAAVTADWMSETYQMTMSDAAIDARAVAARRARKIVRKDIWGNFKDLNLSSSGLVIQTFKLVLLPVWVAKYSANETDYQIFISGQDLRSIGTQPERGIKKLAAWLFSDEE